MAVALLATAARAEPSDGAADPKAAAQQHLDRGNALFTADRYQEALAEFEAAFALYPSPKLRFNMGQCQRALGHAAVAIEQFQRFLADATDVSPDLREEAERYVTELQAQRDTTAPAEATPVIRPPAAEPAPPPPPKLVQEAPTPQPSSARPPLLRRWWFWAAVGVVAAGAAVIVFRPWPHDPACPPAERPCY